MSLNKVMLIGRIDDKPQIREIEGGSKAVGLSIVTIRYDGDADVGEERTSNEWHRVVIIEERLVAFAEAHLQQNDHVYIEGQLHTERWQDETFQWRSLTKILISQSSDQLQKFAPNDDPTLGTRPSNSGLAAARKAHLVEAVNLDARL
ncbi:MAG: single-stranded DNA-binding protein [Pseudomonadota bacterium]